MPRDPAVWLSAIALGRSSAGTMDGSRADRHGWVTARPAASTATRAMISAGPDANASATQTAAWASPVATSRNRLSTRSASRPVQRTSSTGGAAAAISTAATANPPAPRCCSSSTSAVAARKSPHEDTARAPLARYTSPHPRLGRPVRARPAPVGPRPRLPHRLGPDSASVPPARAATRRRDVKDILRSMSFTSAPGKPDRHVIRPPGAAFAAHVNGHLIRVTCVKRG